MALDARVGEELPAFDMKKARELDPIQRIKGPIRKCLTQVLLPNSSPLGIFYFDGIVEIQWDNAYHKSAEVGTALDAAMNDCTLQIARRTAEKMSTKTSLYFSPHSNPNRPFFSISYTSPDHRIDDRFPEVITTGGDLPEAIKREVSFEVYSREREEYVASLFLRLRPKTKVYWIPAKRVRKKK